jgi:hypothetical protein
MLNDEITLPFIIPGKNKLGLYYIIAIVSIFFIGITLYKLNLINDEILSLLFGISFISTFSYIRFSQGMKDFSLSKAGIILKKDGIIKYIENQYQEIALNEIKKIAIGYCGYDEGNSRVTFFGGNPHRGSDNIIKIFYADGTTERNAFYIQTERDSIVLKNILVSLKTKIEIEVIKKIQNTR